MLISAETVDRLPEFYERVKHLPYKPGPAKELNDTYRAMSSGIRNFTIYDAYHKLADRSGPHCTASMDAEPAALDENPHRAVSRCGSGWASIADF